MKRPCLISVLCLSLFACGEEDEPFSCDGTDLMLTLVSVTEASQCGAADGSIVVTASGGKAPYTYILGDQSQTNGNFDGVSSGVHSINVFDSNGCEVKLSNLTVEASDLSFSLEVTEDTDCTAGNGSVTIDVTQGEGPFYLKLEQGDFQETSSIQGLRAGEYLAQLRAGDCLSRISFTIPKGDTGTSWNTDVRPLIEKSCALSGCHNGVSRPDLRVYSTAKSYAGQIKSLTADGSMPFTGSLTREEIDLLACWVDEGSPEN